jgi:hypothetical protein
MVTVNSHPQSRSDGKLFVSPHGKALHGKKVKIVRALDKGDKEHADLFDPAVARTVVADEAGKTHVVDNHELSE